MSRVSIIIPCFNDGQYLLEAVQSARQQTHSDVEIVIVDDGSSDPGTCALFDRLKDEADLVVFRQRNRGLPAARNAAIAISTGDYILPLDSDDRLDPEYAALAAEVLDNEPSVGIVGGEIEYFGLEAGRTRPAYTDLRSILLENCLFTSSVTRRKDWEDVGGYPQELRFGEDWIYWLRILGLGRDVHLLPNLVWFYRMREGQMIRRVQPEQITAAQVFAMRDQPALYIENFDLVVDYLEAKVIALDGFRRKFGWTTRFADWIRGAYDRRAP